MKKTLNTIGLLLTLSFLLASCGNWDQASLTNSSNSQVSKSQSIALGSKLEIAEELIHDMPKDGMKEIMKLFPDLKTFKTAAKWSNENIVWMWPEDWMYSPTNNITVIVCNEMNTPAHIINWKTLSSNELWKVKAMMKEMMDMMWDHDWDMWIGEVSYSNSPAQYASYDPSKFGNWLSENKKTALFFHANWCHVCVALEKNIKNNLSFFPDNSIIYNVNFDKEIALRKKYWVMSQTTLVFVDKNWNEISKLVNPSIQKISKYLALK